MKNSITGVRVQFIASKRSTLDRIIDLAPHWGLVREAVDAEVFKMKRRLKSARSSVRRDTEREKKLTEQVKRREARIKKLDKSSKRRVALQKKLKELRSEVTSLRRRIARAISVINDLEGLDDTFGPYDIKRDGTILSAAPKGSA